VANRTFNQYQGTLQKGVVTLFAKITFDGSGNPTLVTSEEILGPQNPTSINPSNGFAAVTQVPLGPFFGYKLSLQDPYVRLLGAHAVDVGLDNGFMGTSVIQDNVNSNTDPFVTLAFTGANGQVSFTVSGPFPENFNNLSVPTFVAPVTPDGTSGGYILVSLTLANSTAL